MVHEDSATHKWMVYVRSAPGSLDIEQQVSMVRFYLHPSYKPHDIVTVTKPPFTLNRRGWGEFLLRVQLYFKNSLNKPTDIVYKLNLNGKISGLHTRSSETFADLWIHPSPCTGSSPVDSSQILDLASDLMKETVPDFTSELLCHTCQTSVSPSGSCRCSFHQRQQTMSDHSYTAAGTSRTDSEYGRHHLDSVAKQEPNTLLSWETEMSSYISDAAVFGNISSQIESSPPFIVEDNKVNYQDFLVDTPKLEPEPYQCNTNVIKPYEDCKEDMDFINDLLLSLTASDEKMDFSSADQKSKFNFDINEILTDLEMKEEFQIEDLLIEGCKTDTEKDLFTDKWNIDPVASENNLTMNTNQINVETSQNSCKTTDDIFSSVFSLSSNERNLDDPSYIPTNASYPRDVNMNLGFEEMSAIDTDFIYSQDESDPDLVGSPLTPSDDINLMDLIDSSFTDDSNFTNPFPEIKSASHVNSTFVNTSNSDSNLGNNVSKASCSNNDSDLQNNVSKAGSSPLKSKIENSGNSNEDNLLNNSSVKEIPINEFIYNCVEEEVVVGESSSNHSSEIIQTPSHNSKLTLAQESSTKVSNCGQKVKFVIKSPTGSNTNSKITKCSRHLSKTKIVHCIKKTKVDDKQNQKLSSVSSPCSVQSKATPLFVTTSKGYLIKVVDSNDISSGSNVSCLKNSITPHTKPIVCSSQTSVLNSKLPKISLLKQNRNIQQNKTKLHISTSSGVVQNQNSVQNSILKIFPTQPTLQDSQLRENTQMIQNFQSRLEVTVPPQTTKEPTVLNSSRQANTENQTVINLPRSRDVNNKIRFVAIKNCGGPIIRNKVLFSKPGAKKSGLKPILIIKKSGQQTIDNTKKLYKKPILVDSPLKLQAPIDNGKLKNESASENRILNSDNNKDSCVKTDLLEICIEKSGIMDIVNYLKDDEPLS